MKTEYKVTITCEEKSRGDMRERLERNLTDMVLDDDRISGATLEPSGMLTNWLLERYPKECVADLEASIRLKSGTALPHFKRCLRIDLGLTETEVLQVVEMTRP